MHFNDTKHQDSFLPLVHEDSVGLRPSAWGSIPQRGALSFSVGCISRVLLGSQLALELSSRSPRESQLPMPLEWSQASEGMWIQTQADPAQNLSGFQIQRNIS